MIELFKELEVFNKIKFHDEGHSYILDGKRCSSVTGLIHDFETPFDSDLIAEKQSDKLGIDKEVILKKWDKLAHIGTTKGSAFHDYVENYLSNKIFPLPIMEEEILVNVNKIIDMFHKFYERAQGILIPIKSELVVADFDSSICGMIDQLFYNTRSEKLEIWDWKTNKKINKDNQFQSFIKPFEYIQQSEFNIYSIQLSAYKYMIEKSTNLEIGDCYICWFNENNTREKVLKYTDYTKEVKQMIQIKSGK